MVAAGNSGPLQNSITCPGNARKALTIGSIDKENNIAVFSSRGSRELPKPDFVAPGIVKIGKLQLSGTSISAHLVSGSIALLLSKYNMTNDIIFKTLKESSELLDLERFEQGYGKVIYKSDLLNIIGADVPENNLDKLRKINGIEKISFPGKAGIL